MNKLAHYSLHQHVNKHLQNQKQIRINFNKRKKRIMKLIK